MKNTAALTLLDIPWLRRAARVDGVSDAPLDIASKLVSGGLVARTGANVLTITPRGQLALTRLG